MVKRCIPAILAAVIASNAGKTEAFTSPSASPQHLLINTPAGLSTTTSIQVATSPNEDNDIFSERPTEPVLPKYSQSIPFLGRPKELTGELAGDVGFDPMGFAKNRDLLIEYREAEVKHSRIAMLASVGWVIAELYDQPIAAAFQMQPVLGTSARVPSLFNGGMEKVSPVWWGFCLGLTAAIDLYGIQRARSVEGYTPGDLGFDPLNLYPSSDDSEARENMQLAEIKHGRAAMIAITAFSVQEFVTKVGVVEETPWFFKPMFWSWMDTVGAN
jgi:hypothetical protein